MDPVAAVAAAVVLILGIRMWHRNDWRRYSEGEGATIIGGLLLIPVLILWIILIGTAIGRHYSESACTKKAEAAAKPYVWLDYHFFSYECLLRTPSGNITETPVLPLEDVTERSGG